MTSSTHWVGLKSTMKQVVLDSLPLDDRGEPPPPWLRGHGWSGRWKTSQWLLFSSVLQLEFLFYKKDQTCIAILIARNRPHFAPPEQNGEKKGRKMDFGQWDKEGKWPKNGQIGLKWFRMAVIPFFGHFSPFSQWGQKSIRRPFFPHFGPVAPNGVCTGQSGSQNMRQFEGHRFASFCPLFPGRGKLQTVGSCRRFF